MIRDVYNMIPQPAPASDPAPAPEAAPLAAAAPDRAKELRGQRDRLVAAEQAFKRILRLLRVDHRAVTAARTEGDAEQRKAA